MAETDSLNRTISDTVTLSRELREEGQIDGQVKLYNVEEESEFESDAELFFERTLITDGLREALTILRDSLTGEDPRGTHILYGPYGSGKSHQMVALYHCFSAPTVAGDWAGDEVRGLAGALPDTATAVTVALQKRQPDYLWEPLFEELGYDLPSYESGGYPDIETIQEAVGDEHVVFLLDELEDWFDTLSGDRLSANRGFLQSLLEATALSDLNIYSIVSVLREDSVVHDILNREQAVEVNMNNQVDKREVLRHRLIESIDESAVREIVNDYVDEYDRTDHIDDSYVTGLRSEMHDLYPFHPVLLDALETRYYADEGNQNTRGMIYLFSKVLLECADDTDLITAGDIDATNPVFAGELTKIMFSRYNVCVGDIENRVDESKIPYGKRILNTILLYSLKPSEGEGADRSEIVMGTFRTGALIADIVLDLEKLHGVAWHLHKLNGKYAIRDRQNPTALIRNAADDVSEKAAKSEIGGIIEGLFGQNAIPVGFRDGDIRDVPDTRDVTVVIKDQAWTQDEVKEVITNGGRGREWRNTLVFVQPTRDKAIESGAGYIDKARYVEGARQVLADESLNDEIRSSVREQRETEERELRERLELAYGEVLDGDDLLNEWEYAAPMELDVFVGDEGELDAGTIAGSAAADPFDLQQQIWTIAEDLLERRGEVSIEDIYEQFLRQPQYPIPGSANDVLNATVNSLADKPVLAHDSSGFRTDLSGSSLDTMLVHEDRVEQWTVDHVVQELRTRFGGDESAIDVGDFELELLDRMDVWLTGEDSHDVVMMAVGRLAQEDKYVIISGNAILDKPRSDATLRDISGATVVGSAELEAEIRDAIDTDGRADVDRIISDIRADETVYLPPDETETAAREAVNEFIVDDYLFEDDGRYLDTLGDRDPTGVKLVPTVSSHIGEMISEYLSDLEPGDQCTIPSIAEQYDAVTEDAVKTFLLSHLGRDEEPEYVIGPTGSEKASDWVPGYPFRVPDDEGWRFEYNGDAVPELRTKWRDEHRDGKVSYGDVSFMLPEREGIPSSLQGTASVVETRISLTLASEQDYTHVQDMFEHMPDEARRLKIEISFE